jgi:hypothetical protein
MPNKIEVISQIPLSAELKTRVKRESDSLVQLIVSGAEGAAGD